LIKALEQERTV